MPQISSKQCFFIEIESGYNITKMHTVEHTGCGIAQTFVCAFWTKSVGGIHYFVLYFIFINKLLENFLGGMSYVLRPIFTSRDPHPIKSQITYFEPQCIYFNPR